MPVRRHCAVFEQMVEEVARNASVVAQNTAAAKKSASDAGTSAREAGNPCD
ncbi:PPE-repeat protein [Escherichia coli]|uniref:PPE-repeat protein n=1 Tax=Escherichia coli TaxID=562 RepID=A0A2X3KDD6_ECOLX|nr:PPE-repeat protein [Escherichia coli]